MLGHLGVSPRPPSLDSLHEIARAWLFCVPFHNLDLLAGTSPVTEEGAAAACLSLRGGGCHIHAAGLRALLLGLGYEATLAAASIGQPGDHLIVRIQLAGALVWCDLGNGQPYLVPFRVGEMTTCEHLGWSVRALPDADGMNLWRCNTLQPNWHRVYRTRLEPRTWDDFSEAIARHHEEPGFGPFLTGIRAVKIRKDEMITVRDETVTHWSRDGVRERGITDDNELGRELLRIVDDRRTVGVALASWRAARSMVAP